MMDSCPPEHSFSKGMIVPGSTEDVPRIRFQLFRSWHMIALLNRHDHLRNVSHPPFRQRASVC